MKSVIIFFLIVLAGSCNNLSHKQNTSKSIDLVKLTVPLKKNNGKETLSSEKSDTINIANEQIVPQIDTLSLSAFWESLQRNISIDKREVVIEGFNFPIRAIYPVLFKYAHDCDTISYSENEDKYHNFDITQNIIGDYYDFVFTEELKKVISETSVKDLLSKGYVNKKIPGVTYTFFPRDYDIKVNCPNDHNMKFHFIFKNNKWKISIGGL